jgi:hypothetical protein
LTVVWTGVVALTVVTDCVRSYRGHGMGLWVVGTVFDLDKRWCAILGLNQ